MFLLDRAGDFLFKPRWTNLDRVSETTQHGGWKEAGSRTSFFTLDEANGTVTLCTKYLTESERRRLFSTRLNFTVETARLNLG